MIDLHDQKRAAWLKARESQSFGMCVEVAELDGDIAVRHSLAPADGAIRYTKAEFRAFVNGCRNGEFDHLL